MIRTYRIIALACLTYIATSCNQNKTTLFKNVDPSASGITFNNTIIENDSMNILDYENIYNGGGVGVGDFNNDGLPDLYFTGNLVANKLYLNKGEFKFQDITEQSGTNGNGRWCRGVSVIDINSDGLQDIYISATGLRNAEMRQNLLYINQGNGANGIPQFKDMAKEYGLNDTTYSTMASFFDYDNDGDLDMYLCVNDIIQGDFPNRFRPRLLNGEHPSTGRLYRNNGSDSLGHPFFTNVSKEAGVTIEGYGHSATITDINLDGWKDIYVTNDYLSQNILYINNKNGTFTDNVKSYFKHTSANAMGSDIVDINNDGLSDLIELDMNPQDNLRKKMMLNANSYQTYQNSDYLGYQYQYVRNTLQLNQGRRVNGEDSLGDPIFSDIAFYSGIAETDWSWAPVVTDFDNDGNRDILITNGFPKDVTDHDFVTFRNDAFAVAEKKVLLDEIPAVKIHNYAYKNNGNLTFSDVSASWGLTTPSFSNGAVYVDLDNDGDMDFVVNNINDAAQVYQNTLRDNDADNHHFLRMHLKGDTLNKSGIGTWIEVYTGSRMQVFEQNPFRGYLSSVQADAHFGLDSLNSIDSVIVKWPNGKLQTIKNLKGDTTLTVDIKDANGTYNWELPVKSNTLLFTNITKAAGIDYVQQEKDFIDFNIQKLLPHKFSEAGPALAVGDLDGNKLDDIVIGGSYGHSATILLQQPNGKFAKKDLINEATEFNKRWEDEGIVIFDADGDGDNDMYITSGSYENAANGSNYGDKIYVNDGRGNYIMDTTGLPVNYTSKSCVRAADFDKDGDLDLFIGGRVEPWNFPKPVNSYIYRNDSKDGKIVFTDISAGVAPFLSKIGLVTDAVWTDFDNDEWPDLIITGEWMSPLFIKNASGQFKDVTSTTGVESKLGWWRSIVPGDFDNDGDMDYIVGNMGLNSFYRASDQYPVGMYAKDFDKNGSYDAVPFLYLPATLLDPQMKQYPAQTRDDMVKQIIGFRTKFQNYKLYADATIDKMFTAEELKGAQVMKATIFSHCLLKNNGAGKFEMIALPGQSQISCINGMLAEDADGDGLLDIIINGNDYGTEVSIGRYDGCNGLVMRGDGKGSFRPMAIAQSGLYIPGNGKALVKLIDSKNQVLVSASQNRGPLELYKMNGKLQVIKVNPGDVYAMITYENGKKQKQEFGYGSSYLSQSGRFLNLSSSAVSVEITDSKMTKRTISLR